MPFPHCDILITIYGKDEATREASETFVDAIKNIQAKMAKEAMIVDIDEDDGGESNSKTRLMTQNVKKEYVHEPPSKKAKSQKTLKGKGEKENGKQCGFGFYTSSNL